MITFIQKIVAKKSAYVALMIVIVSGLIGGFTVKDALFASSTDAEVELQGSVAAEPTTIKATKTATGVQPQRLIIPSISVNAEIDDVGISKHNTIAVPESYSEVGWYRYGAVPGEPGIAIMDGHLDNGFGLPAVFKRLKELTAGDEILVMNAQGDTVRFEVTTLETFKNDESIRHLFTKSSDAQLVLITCVGEWLPEDKMYSDRLLVTARYTGMVSE